MFLLRRKAPADPLSPASRIWNRLSLRSTAALSRRLCRIPLPAGTPSISVQCPIRQRALDAVRELTGGYGADAVLECVGMEEKGESYRVRRQCATDRVSRQGRIVI